MYLVINGLNSIVSLTYRYSPLKYTHVVLWNVWFIASFQGTEMNSNLHLVINLSKSLMFSESEDKDDEDEEYQDEDGQDDDSNYGSEEEDYR